MKRVDRQNPKTTRYYRRWTARDDKALRLLWGASTLPTLARELGRTELSVYWRARHLGLEVGVPQGYESLTDAATRAGYTTTQLRPILRAAGVPLHATLSRPETRPRAFRFHYVDPLLVDDAVAAWVRQETTEEAGRRHGTCAETIRRLLVAAGHAPPRRRKKHWRVDPVLVDSLVAVWRATASVRAHAMRLGVRPTTLAAWLRGAGELGKKRAGVEVKLPRDVVDRVAAEHRARPNCRAPGRRAA